MRILFMGTPQMAVPSLQELVHNKFNIIGVATQPDRPKGRDRQLSISAVKYLAQAHNLPVFAPNSIRKDKEFIGLVKNQLKPDLCVVIAYGQILPSEFLQIPQHGCINLHFSLLPKYRGAAPVAWALIKGESNTGLTTMYLNEKMDEGDIIYQEKIPISGSDTRPLLELKLSEMGAKLLLKTIQDIESGIAPGIPQDHSKASYAPRLTTEMGNIPWDKSANEIFNLVRGINPDPGAFTYFQGKRIRILDVSLNSNDRNSSKPGIIINIEKGLSGGLSVSTNLGSIFIKSVQPEGRKIISALDFSNGYRIKQGDRFTGKPG